MGNSSSMVENDKRLARSQEKHYEGKGGKLTKLNSARDATVFGLDTAERRTSSRRSLYTTSSDNVVFKAVKHLAADIKAKQDHTMKSFDLVTNSCFCSPEVRKVMTSSLILNSYCIGLPGSRSPGDNSDIDAIEAQTRQVACEVYEAKYCDVQSSGLLANIAAYNAMLPYTGCTVMLSPIQTTAHHSDNARGPLERFFGANIVQIPLDEDSYNIDMEALPLAVETHKPALLILGCNEMLFEHDLAVIRNICDDHDCKLMYDMSHVAGLVAGGVFQNKLMKHVDIVVSSTGKSLHSSADHGFVLYNDPSLMPRIQEVALPSHFHETSALYMALIEMTEFGHAYATQVVANSRALARELERRDFKVLGSEMGYTQTHQIILDLEGVSGTQATMLLEKAGVFVNPHELPQDITGSTGATGLRLGTQVLTRRGFEENDMVHVAEVIGDVLKRQIDPISVSKLVDQKCSNFFGTSFAFGSDVPGSIVVQEDSSEEDDTSDILEVHV